MIDVHILGDGPDDRACHKLIEELNIQEYVHFHGWIDDVTEWYKRLDLIVMPSRFEGFPLVTLEAMLYGVPVVSSCVDGMKEVLPSHWLFPEGDGELMREKVKRVLREDQSVYVKKNRYLILKRFNLTSYKESFAHNVTQICA